MPQYFFLCLVIQHQHHFVTITHSLQFPLHPFRGIHQCSRKNFVLFLRDTCQLFLGKERCQKFISKTSIVESFLSYRTVFHRSFLKGYLQQLFCIEPSSACFCKKETPLQMLFQELSGTLKTRKSEGYIVFWLQFCNLQNRNSITTLFLKIIKNF